MRSLKETRKKSQRNEERSGNEKMQPVEKKGNEVRKEVREYQRKEGIKGKREKKGRAKGAEKETE